MRGFFGIKKDRSLSVDWIYHFGSTVNDLYTFTAPLPYTENDPTPKNAPQKSDGKVYENLIAGIGGGPVLVKNGLKKITYNEEIMWGAGVGLTNNDPRTAVGYTADKHVLIFVADGRSTASEGVSLSELADIMIKHGCVEVLNLDGGGSTQMSLGSDFINQPSENRPVTAILAIVNPDSLKIPKEPLYEKIIDTEDTLAKLSGTGWFPTSNPGYYGTSKSMLNPIGSGSSYAEYTIAVPAQAKYQIYAWWVADANNRSKNTPFIIKHKNGVDTVRKDQSANGAKWNLIGEYTLAAGKENNLTISNAATTGTYIVADAIRIVSFDSTVLTDVASVDKKITVSQINLEQNYPNPFNPSSNISYSLPCSGMVNLKIFDVLGREVLTIVNRVEAPGEHMARFAMPCSLSSGIYFYRLQLTPDAKTADSYKTSMSQTKKMIYMK
jgi:hypothetical protein